MDIASLLVGAGAILTGGAAWRKSAKVDKQLKTENGMPPGELIEATYEMAKINGQKLLLHMIDRKAHQGMEVLPVSTVLKKDN